MKSLNMCSLHLYVLPTVVTLLSSFCCTYHQQMAEVMAPNMWKHSLASVSPPSSFSTTTLAPPRSLLCSKFQPFFSLRTLLGVIHMTVIPTIYIFQHNLSSALVSHVPIVYMTDTPNCTSNSRFKFNMSKKESIVLLSQFILHSS